MLFGHQCEWCDGTVQDKQLPREVFRHVTGFVILEDVPVGICDKCGRKYYSAKTLHRVEAIATHHADADRTESIPVAHA